MSDKILSMLLDERYRFFLNFLDLLLTTCQQGFDHELIVMTVLAKQFLQLQNSEEKKTQMFIVFFKYVSTICFIHFQSVEKWNWWTKTKNETQNILLVSRFIVVTVYFKIFKILENSWKELNYLKGRDVRCVLPKSSQYNLNHSNPEFEKWKWWRRLNYFNYLKILCSVPASSHLEHILFI